MFPDLLREYHGDYTQLPAEWDTFWFLIEPAGKLEAGRYPIEIQLLNTNGEHLLKACYILNILEAELPLQTLKHTEWLYTDCIAQQYRTKMFSERFWEMLEQYFLTASRFGVNMVYTPVVTSLLSSKTGLIRPETQLTEIFLENGEYRFDFEKLEHFIRLAQQCGIRYFEMCHLFTQWGGHKSGANNRMGKRGFTSIRIGVLNYVKPGRKSCCSVLTRRRPIPSFKNSWQRFCPP